MASIGSLVGSPLASIPLTSRYSFIGPSLYNDTTYPMHHHQGDGCTTRLRWVGRDLLP